MIHAQETVRVSLRVTVTVRARLKRTTIMTETTTRKSQEVLKKFREEELEISKIN